MNTAAQTFALAFGSVLAAAAIGVALANHMADAAPSASRSALATPAEPASSPAADLPQGVTEQHPSAEALRVAQAPSRQAM